MDNQLHPDLTELAISRRELEQLTALEIGKLFVAQTYRPSVLCRSAGIVRFLMAQCLAIGIVGMTTILPVSKFFNDSNQRDRQIPIYCTTITLVVMLGGNTYLHWRQRRVKVLLRLLDEVDRFNQVVQSAGLMYNLAQVGSPATDVEELRSVLSLTRQNLLASLQIDRLLRHSQGMHYGLLQHIEDNLAHLQQINSNPTADEYSQLLKMAGKIGQDIYQELQS
jgi:hypothetical protein